MTLDQIFKEEEIERRIQRLTKEISLETLYNIYFKISHKYRGYGVDSVEKKYSLHCASLCFIRTFEEFVHVFKIYNYRIM